MLHVFTNAHYAVNLTNIIMWKQIISAVNGVLCRAIDVPNFGIWYALLPQFNILCWQTLACKKHITHSGCINFVEVWPKIVNNTWHKLGFGYFVIVYQSKHFLPFNASWSNRVNASTTQ